MSLLIQCSSVVTDQRTNFKGALECCITCIGDAVHRDRQVDFLRQEATVAPPLSIVEVTGAFEVGRSTGLLLSTGTGHPAVGPDNVVRGRCVAPEPHVLVVTVLPVDETLDGHRRRVGVHWSHVALPRDVLAAAVGHFDHRDQLIDSDVVSGSIDILDLELSQTLCQSARNVRSILHAIVDRHIDDSGAVPLAEDLEWSVHSCFLIWIDCYEGHIVFEASSVIFLAVLSNWVATEIVASDGFVLSS